MLRAGDVAVLPREGMLEEGDLRIHRGGGPFPDFVLETVLREVL